MQVTACDSFVEYEDPYRIKVPRFRFTEEYTAPEIVKPFADTVTIDSDAYGFAAVLEDLAHLLDPTMSAAVGEIAAEFKVASNRPSIYKLRDRIRNLQWANSVSHSQAAEATLPAPAPAPASAAEPTAPAKAQGRKRSTAVQPVAAAAAAATATAELSDAVHHNSKKVKRKSVRS